MFSAPIVGLSWGVIDVNTLFRVAQSKVCPVLGTSAASVAKANILRHLVSLENALAFDLNDPNYHHKLPSHKQTLIAEWNRSMSTSAGERAGSEGAGEPAYS